MCRTCILCTERANSGETKEFHVDGIPGDAEVSLTCEVCGCSIPDAVIVWHYAICGACGFSSPGKVNSVEYPTGKACPQCGRSNLLSKELRSRP